MWTWLSELFGARAEEPAAGVNPQRGPTAPDSAPSNPEDPGRDLNKLRKLLEIHGVKVASGAIGPLYDSLMQGRKIEAIKRIRIDGKPRLSLKEAKLIIDAFDL